MGGTTIKKIQDVKNKTRKNRLEKAQADISRLTQEQRALICKKSANTYNTFEDKIEESFKKQNIDFLSTNYNLEKDIIKNLREAVSPDFYSYINER